MFQCCSICLVKFAGQPDLTHCLVGVSKDHKLNPRSVAGGFIYTYKVLHRLSPVGRSESRLELVHKTTLDEIPYAMCAFQGRVLVGVGSCSAFTTWERRSCCGNAKIRFLVCLIIA